MLVRVNACVPTVTLFSVCIHVSVPGECSSKDVQTLGLHGHDGAGKTDTCDHNLTAQPLH